MMRSWIHKLFARPATRPIRKGAPSTTRLLLDQLEAREVPSISPLAPRAGEVKPQRRVVAEDVRLRPAIQRGHDILRCPALG